MNVEQVIIKQTPMITLSPSQKEAFEKIREFINSDAQIFILKGHAGTGKTTLIQQLTFYFKEIEYPYQLLATTGRAASILGSKINELTSTVHSFTYNFDGIIGDNEEAYTTDDNSLFGSMKLLFGIKNMSDEKFKLVIVDESSMLSSQISDESDSARFGSGIVIDDFFSAIGDKKVIFTGDPCQIPPINQPNSPALTQEYFTDLGKSVVEFELKENMRIEDKNDILDLARDVRSYINSEITQKQRYVKLPAKNRRDTTVTTDQGELFEHFYNSIIEDSHNSIAICLTNKFRNDINSRVRMRKYGDSNAPLQVGEMLLVTQNNYLTGINNGELIVVLEIGAKKQNAFLNYSEVKIRKLSDNKEYSLLICIDAILNIHGNISSSQHQSMMISFSREMKAKGISSKDRAYNIALQSDPYLNSLRANFGYCLTCHKAQGGEWQNVFFFLNKSMYGLPQKQMLQLWYTGITRSKKRLHLHNDWWIK